MERQVAIVTDSTACLPPALASELKIEVVPVLLAFQDGVVLGDDSERSEELSRRLSTAKTPPLTSTPSPGLYVEAIRRALLRAPDVICVTVSRRFSTMVDSANAARDLLTKNETDRVRVLDSGNAAMGQGFVTLAAATAARGGATVEECLTAVQTVASGAHLLFALGSLRFLAQGGRVPHALAWATRTLGIRPIVHYHAGSVRLVARPRSDEKALSALLDRVGRLSGGEGGDLHVAIQQTGAPELAQRLSSLAAERYCPKTMLQAPFTAAIAAHTGPGVFGLAFYRESANRSAA